MRLSADEKQVLIHVIGLYLHQQKHGFGPALAYRKCRVVGIYERLKKDLKRQAEVASK